MVEGNYQNHPHDNETKIMVDPELSCKTEIFIDEDACIKAEFESTSFCDEPNDHELREIKEENLTFQDSIEHAKGTSATIQEAVFVDCSSKTKKKRESKVYKAKPVLPAQTKVNKTKSSPSEPKRNRYRGMKEAHTNADGFE